MELKGHNAVLNPEERNFMGVPYSELTRREVTPQVILERLQACNEITNNAPEDDFLRDAAQQAHIIASGMLKVLRGRQ